MECAAAIHFIQSRGWEKVMDACPQHPNVRQHQLAGGSWESVCKAWWEILQACVCSLGVPHCSLDRIWQGSGDIA